MGHTQGAWTQDGAPNDMQLFIDATEFVDTSANAVVSTPTTSAPASLTLASTLAATLHANLGKFLNKRTGIYAIPALSQEQFGTAAAQPGPSAVSGTSGPLAQVGFPPQAGSAMSTVAGPVNGPIPKGIQINSIDFIYKVATVNASGLTVQLQKIVFADGADPVFSDIIASGAHSLPVAFAAHEYVKNVAVASPAMIVDSDADLQLWFNITAGSGGTVTFYGVVLHVSYNFN